MNGSTDEGSSREATSDHVDDLAEHRTVRADLERRAGTGVERTPILSDVRRVDHSLGVVLTLGGELDLATVPLLQEQLDRAMCAGGQSSTYPGCGSSTRAVSVRWCERSGSCAPRAGNWCLWADGGLCAASLSSRIVTSSGATPQGRLYAPRASDASGPGGSPIPAPTERRGRA